jgi:hypothetical protein
MISNIIHHAAEVAIPDPTKNAVNNTTSPNRKHNACSLQKRGTMG